MWVIKPKFDPQGVFTVRRKLKLSGVEVQVGDELSLGHPSTLTPQILKRLYASDYLALKALQPKPDTLESPRIPTEVRVDEVGGVEVVGVPGMAGAVGVGVARKPLSAAQSLTQSLSRKSGGK